MVDNGRIRTYDLCIFIPVYPPRGDIFPSLFCAYKEHNVASCSIVIDNIFVDNNITTLSTVSPIVNDLSGHDVFVSVHFYPICLEMKCIIIFMFLPHRDLYHTLFSYKSTPNCYSFVFYSTNKI